MTPNRRGDETRRVVLDAAEREFLDHGYGGARVERIASAAQVSVGTLYLHFRDKQGLYSAVLLRVQSVLLAEYIAPVFALTAPPWDRIRAWCHAYLRFTIEHPGRARIMAVIEWPDSRWLPDVTAEVRRQTVQGSRELLAVFEEAGERGELAGLEPSIAARFVWWAMYGLAAQNLRQPEVCLDGDELHALADAGLLLMSRGRSVPPDQIDE